jgi:ADP-heptose:LPS heptosyltransferase
VKKILLFRLSAMGDVALTVPVIRNVIESNPELQLTLVTKPFFAPFFFGIPRLKLVFPDLNGEHKGLSGLFRLYKDLKNRGPFEAIIDLHSVLRTQIVSTLFLVGGTPVFSIDKGRKEKTRLIRTKKIKQLKHTTDRYIEVFQKAGIEAKIGRTPSIDYSTEAFQSARSYLLGKIPEKGYLKIGLSPFANTQPKIWGLENFKELITLINQHHKAVFFLFGGGEKEIRLLAQLEQHSENIHLVAGNFTLSEEIAMIRMLDIMIAMDSSNMHLASLSGVRTISIWGGTHPAFGFSALGQPDEYHIQPMEGILKCRPCSVFGGKPCIYPTVRCMELITATDLYATLVRLDVLKAKPHRIILQKDHL